LVANGEEVLLTGAGLINGKTSGMAVLRPNCHYGTVRAEKKLLRGRWRAQLEKKIKRTALGGGTPPQRERKL